MTTLTSRSMPLVPLQLNLSALSANAASDASASGSLVHTLHSHVNNCLPADAMHLSPKEERLSPQSRYGSEISLKNSLCDIVHRGSIDSRKSLRNMITDDMSDARSSSVSSYQADSYHKEQDDDQMSYCSDESELSVGKEVESEQPFQNRSKRVPSDADTESVDGSLADRTTAIMSQDDVSNDAHRFPSRIPNIIRPSPTRFQEEFLRKSQLYAEELMKHQMNFMAATRGLNISPKIGDQTFGYPIKSDALSPIRGGDETKIGFRPTIARPSADLEKKWSTIEDRSSQSPEATNFRGIHSHLNAISKITSALGRDMMQFTSPNSITSRENSQSPPTHHFQQMLNNNLAETNLKFSIDNILKPSFGRRITDPLLKRNKNARKNVQRSTENSDKHTGAPIDLTANPATGSSIASAELVAASTPSKSQAPAVTEQDKAATPSKGSGPMVWPAWVYCTRYSDRPSSGKFLNRFPYFVTQSVYCCRLVAPAFRD